MSIHRVRYDNPMSILWVFYDSEMRYDKNGNLTKDLNKKIFSIQYNSLNLPSKINYSDGKMMDYVYSGTGEKKSVTDN